MKKSKFTDELLRSPSVGSLPGSRPKRTIGVRYRSDSFPVTSPGNQSRKKKKDLRRKTVSP
jgi:hypothetical protein